MVNSPTWSKISSEKKPKAPIISSIAAKCVSSGMSRRFLLDHVARTAGI